MTSRQDKVLNGAAYWGAYYRNNPDKFVNDYLHIDLRLFQKILIVMMFCSTTFVWIAARGLGKTFLSAVYCCARCILYPGTKICIASGTRGQAINVLEKIIQELKPGSFELCAEIDERESHINNTSAQIVFKNTSVIKVVTASDSSRGNRCNVLLLDEYRLISKQTIDTVLKNFLTLRRTPRYEELTDEERKEQYSKEKNLALYLSSAYFKNHWSFLKCIDTFRAMLDDKRKQFVCGLPYYLSIEEGLLDPEMVADKMAESDFSEIKHQMEMCALFYGSEEDAFFDFDVISKNRKIKYPYLPDKISSKLLTSSVTKIPPKQNGEKRILSADIALMSSKRNKNDATSIFVNFLTPTKTGRYLSNIVYADCNEGLRTEEQALVIRKLFDEYQCDYIVLDTNGIGLGVFDALARDIMDSETGEIYPALSCCNNSEMADRCTNPYAKKVIYSVKASAQFNSDCAFALREGFLSGRIRLLTDEFDAEEELRELRGYNGLSPAEKVKFELPYIHTTLLIDELVNLQHEENNGKIKISEKPNMRKDRYSSLSYNYYLAVQLENKLRKNTIKNTTEKTSFVFKPPKYKAERR